MRDIGMILLIAGLIGLGPSLGALLVRAGRGSIGLSLRLHHGIVAAHFVVLAVLGVQSVVQSPAGAPAPMAHTLAVDDQPAFDRAASSFSGPVRTPDQGGAPDRDGPAATTPRNLTPAPPIEPLPGPPLRSAGRDVGLDSGAPGLVRATARNVGEAAAPVAALGAIISLVVAAISLVRLHRLELASRLNAETRVRGRVTVYVSDRVRIPFTCGVVAPRIYLPSHRPSSSDAGAAARESHAAVLDHELAHVAHNDVLWNTLEQFLRVLLWFSPIVHLLSRRGRLLREMRADRVAARRSDPVTYASTLVAVAESARRACDASAFSLPLARGSRRPSRRRALRDRVEFVLHGTSPRSALGIAGSTAVAVGVLLLVAGCVTPGVRPEYLGLPLAGYSVEERDDSGRVMRSEWYDGDTRECVHYSEYRYVEDSKGRVTQHVTSWRDGEAEPSSHGAVPMLPEPRIEAPLVTYPSEDGHDPAATVTWPPMWELRDGEDRLVRAYLVDYDERHRARGGDPLSADRLSYAFTYDAEGSSAFARFDRGAGPSSYRLERFDAEGTMVWSRNLTRDGQPLWQTTVEYDTTGRVARRISRDESGTILSVRVVSSRPDGTRVEACYRDADDSTISFWPYRGAGLGGPWTTVAGVVENGLRISVLERDYHALAPQAHEAIARAFAREIEGSRDRVVAKLKRTLRLDFPVDRHPDEALNETVDIVFRVTSNGARVVGPSERFTPWELLRDAIGQEIASGTGAPGRGYGTILNDGDAADLTYLVEMSVALHYDPATGLHWVAYPAGVTELLDDPAPAPVQLSAPVAGLLPATPGRFLGDGVDTVIVDITVTPDGTVVDPALVYAAPEPTSPAMEQRLIDELWGRALRPTGLASDAVITLRVSSGRHTGVEEPVVVSSADARLARWFGVLGGDAVGTGAIDPGFAWPLEAGQGSVTQAFGPSVHPFTGKEYFHNGVDIASNYGARVLAAREGTVHAVMRDPASGLTIVLSHEDGLTSHYSHLSSALVSLGERVAVGHPIGRVGTSGMTTGPHLDFRVGRRQDDHSAWLAPRFGG